MLHTVRYPANDVPYTVYNWLEDNCQGKFYTGYDWNNTRTLGERIIQFENENDAIMFSLRWL